MDKRTSKLRSLPPFAQLGRIVNTNITLHLHGWSNLSTQTLFYLHLHGLCLQGQNRAFKPKPPTSWMTPPISVDTISFVPTQIECVNERASKWTIYALSIAYFPNSFMFHLPYISVWTMGYVRANGGGWRHEVRILEFRRIERAWACPWGWRWKQRLFLYLKSWMFIFILKVMVNIICIIIYTKILSMLWQFIASLHIIPSSCSSKCICNI